MGKQSSRIYFNRKDHKDIFFNGHYHKAMYITDLQGKPTLMWEKLVGDIPTYSFIVQDTTINGETLEVVSAGEAYIYVGKPQNKKFTIDWGDGTKTVSDSSNNAIEYIHRYPTSNGTKYKVTLTGDFDRFMGTAKDTKNSCIVELTDALLPQMAIKSTTWEGLYSTSIMFRYAKTLKKVCGNLFENIKNLGQFSIDEMFAYSGIIETPYGLFEGMSMSGSTGLFKSCHNLITIAAGTFNGAYAGNNTDMFKDCINLKYLFDVPIAGTVWDYAFENNKSLEMVMADFEGGSSFKNTFAGCENLMIISENIFEKSPYANNFESCFSGCVKLNEGVTEDLFANNKGAINVNSAFDGCIGITGILPRLWERPEYDVSNITYYLSCYRGCNNAQNYNEVPNLWKM